MIRRLIVVVFVALAVVLPFPRQAVAQSDRLCFPEVPGIGNCIEGRFREYWVQNGGLPVFGYPVSPATMQQTAEGTFLTQYFERNRFELHPENAAPYDVLLGRLGDDRLRQQGRDWQTFPKAQPSAAHYFAQSGHAIENVPFWTYWSTHGLEFDGRQGKSEAESLALFGLPISEPAMETNASGANVLTQWFERARLEYHPNNPDPFKVLLGLLGNEVRGGASTPPGPGPTTGPPPQPTAAPAAGVPILSDTTYESGGASWIVGEVRNDTGRNVRFVRVVANLYDSGNRLIGTDFTYTSMDILRPGQRSPFTVIVLSPPSNFHHYTLQLEWDATTDESLGGLTLLSSGERAAGFGDARFIFGEVRNDSGGPVRFVEIVATLYDAAGKVVGASLTFTSLENIPAGGTSAFEMAVLSWNNAARYELQIQARRP